LLYLEYDNGSWEGSITLAGLAGLVLRKREWDMELGVGVMLTTSHGNLSYRSWLDSSTVARHGFLFENGIERFLIANEHFGMFHLSCIEIFPLVK
jgi:hypothetical protein